MAKKNPGVTISVHVPADIARKITRMAEEEKRAISQMARMLLIEALAKYK